MDIRVLTPDYAVAPQVSPGDMAAAWAAGYRVVINNRPDSEIEADLAGAAMRAAAEAAGLVYVENPVSGAGLTYANVEAQRDAIAAATGPVLAYCRSGTRSTVVWAMAQALDGRLSTDAILAAAARGGYDLSAQRERIDGFAHG